MEVVNASLAPPLKGKCLSVNDALVKLVPCESSRKALSTFCLLGKVVAPMSVSEANIMEFVAKAWKFPVSVVALAEGSNHSNWFELRFSREEDRSWALDHGPWCIRGYTFFLHVWSSTSDSPVLSDTMRIWVQVHNIPHEFFSMANGLLLGGTAGKVVYVDLKENDPASWGKYLKILIEKDFNSPLFSGCFFDLDSGVKRWLQFKYEQVGIFCYFCGRLGHQRRGCTLTSPELVTSDNGTPFPLFGPWLSTSSTYRDVFSSANSFSPCRENSGYALYAPFRRPSKVVALGHGEGDFRRSVSTIARGSTRSGMVTKRGALSAGTGTVHRSEWVSKLKPAGVVPPSSKSGRESEDGIAQMEKVSEVLPVIEQPISEAIEDRSLKIVPDLNLCEKNSGNILVDRAHVKPVSAGGPKVGADHFGVNYLHKDKLTFNSFGDKRRDVGLIGPCVKDSGPNSNLVDKISGPMILDMNMGINTQVVSNINHGPMGPDSLGVNDNSIGPINPSQAIIGHVEASSNSILPIASHGVVEQDNEDQALTQFFNAQESLLYDLIHFGNLDLYEIRKIGGDIGVPVSSEVNERTTPFKKRKFEASASLCSRPHKIPCKYPEVVRDFPWDTKHQANDSNLVIDDPSKDNENL
ncbi:hypothetical protein F8388_018045 [Cannabis sativa]|uniref:CCHC-type domain-containing protein n=1 Tax=Cannabis sativa TaxID=3483 RepID=A0A7J6E953_CANSA|nr:hypothetical protein F8388_018045 [Cannabis sativa]